MKKLIKLDFNNTTKERKTEDSYSELYSHDKNNGSFEFEILNDTLTTEQVTALFKFTESNKIWKTTGTVEGNKVHVTFDTTLITQNETVICYLYFDEEQRTSDTFRFKFKVKVSEIDKMSRYEVKERFINNTVIVDRLDVVTKNELKEALKNVGGIATEGLLTEVKAEELYAKKSETIDNTNFELVKNRVLALELKTDKDTIYNDSELRNRVEVLENKPPVDLSNYATKDELRTVSGGQPLADNLVTKEELENKHYISDVSNLATKEELNEVRNSQPTVDTSHLVTKQELEEKQYLTAHQDLSEYAKKSELYNDTPLKERVTALESKAIEGGAYDDSDLRNRVVALESKEDKDTKYDDTEVKRRLTELESKPVVDTSVFITEEKLNSKGYLTQHQSLENVVTKNELESKGYLKTHQDISNLATKEELAKAVTKDELEAKHYVTEEELNNKAYLTSHQDLSNYALKSEIPQPYNDSTLNERVTALESKAIEGGAYDDSDLRNRVVALEGKEDKDTKYDDTDLRNRVTNLENKPPVDTSEFVTKDELTNKGYLTTHQSLDHVVTKDELETKGYLTQHQSLEEYAKKSELYNDTDIKQRLTTLESKPNIDTSNFVTNEQLEGKHYLTEHQTLTHLATTSDLEALRNVAISKSELSKKVDATEYNSFKDSVVTKTELTEKGYLTEHQNLDGYAKKSELETLNQTLSLTNGVLSISGGNSVALPASQYEIHGTGMPNGVVEAEIGTTYIDKNKTNGAFKWIKTTNGGNQGWEVLTGDTGWRTLNSTSKLTVEGRTSTIKIRRVNNLVTYNFGGLQWGWFGIVRRGGAGHVQHKSSGERGTKVLPVDGIPPGFRSEASLVGGTYDDRGRPYGVWYLGGVNDSNYIQFTFNDPIPTDRDIGDIRVSAVSYLTSEPWPVQLP